MPELPEAEVTARMLRSRLVGAQIREYWIGRKDIIRHGYEALPWYKGSWVEEVERRGKTVLLTLSRRSETRYLAAELGMTGLLVFQSATIGLPQHTHLVLYLDKCSEPELRYWNPRRFGRIHLLEKGGLEEFLARRFGLDALSMGKDDFARVIHAARARLKPLLMHQQVIAGIGNIYANEILFRAGLHPHQMADRLTPPAVERLYDAIQKVLSEAIDAGGSSIRDYMAPDGRRGRYTLQHQVYGKTGQLCQSGCGNLIRRLVGDRSSFYCPVCQKKTRTRKT